MESFHKNFRKTLDPLLQRLGVYYYLKATVIILVLLAVGFTVFPVLGPNFAFKLGIAALVALLLYLTEIETYGRPGNFEKPENSWVHWHYQPDEWNYYVTDEWEQLRERYLYSLLFVPAAFIILLILLSLPMGLVVSLGVAVIAGALYLDGETFYLSRLNRVGEIYINDQNVFLSERVIPLDRLLGAEVEPGYPTLLKLRFLGRNFSSNSLVNRRKYEVRVPVPKGQEDEAWEMVRRLTQQKHFQMLG